MSLTSTLSASRGGFKVMDSAMPVPQVGHASVYMEAMGLWHPPLGPDELAWDFA